MYVSNVRQLSRYRRTRKIFSATRRIRTLSSVHILFAFLSSLTSSTPLDKLLEKAAASGRCFRSALFTATTQSSCDRSRGQRKLQRVNGNRRRRLRSAGGLIYR